MEMDDSFGESPHNSPEDKHIAAQRAGDSERDENVFELDGYGPDLLVRCICE